MNTGEAMVTVIVPVYNTAPYLEDLRDSLASQTYPGFRVIAVDDGSTDGSGDLLRRFCEEDARWTVISQENRGVSAARNAGLDFFASQERRTKYLIFFDSDDMLRPDAFELLLRRIEEHELDDLLFATEPFYENDDLAKRFGHYGRYYSTHGFGEEVMSGLDYLTQGDACGNFRVDVSAQMLRTEFLLDNRIRFKEGIIHEDDLFTIECMARAEKVAFLDEKLDRRRLRPGSIMTTAKSWRNVDGYFQCGVAILDLVRELGDSLNEEHRESLGKRNRLMFRRASNLYAKLPEDERAFLGTYYEPVLQTLFQLTVADSAERNAELHAKDAKIRELEERAIQFDSRLRESVRQARLDKDAHYRKSNSYRIGRAITYVPRAIKRQLKRK